MEHLESFPHAPRKRLKHLINHPKPKKAISMRGELRKLSSMFKACTDPVLAMQLSKRMNTLRRQIKPTVKKAVGRPRVEKPVLPVDPYAAILAAEKAKRAEIQSQPNPVEEQAKRLRIRAEMKKDREALETPIITAPTIDNQEPDGVVIPPQQTGYGVVSPGLIDMFQTIHRSLDGDEEIGSVCMTNALLHNFERQPDPPEPVGEGSYLSEWNWEPKSG
jgi:hypothetical protein